MKLEWESNFETGVEYIDMQHRYFVDLINRIRKNYKETDDDVYQKKLIDELKKYADFHFTSEENILIALEVESASPASSKLLDNLF